MKGQGLAKWRLATEKILDDVREANLSLHKLQPKREWKHFGQEKVDILLGFLNNNRRGSSDHHEAPQLFHNPDRVVQLFQEDLDFLSQCFIETIASREMETKFLELYQFVEKATSEGKLNPHIVWNKVFPALLLKAMECNDPTEVVRELLRLAYDSSPPKLTHSINSSSNVESLKNGDSSQLSPPCNDPILLRACEMNHFEILKLLVERGYRLKSRYLNDQIYSESDRFLWREYTRLPFFQDEEFSESFSDANDEVFDLHILRAMSKPAYILACYSVIVDSSNLDGELGCECLNQTRDVVEQTAKQHYTEKGSTVSSFTNIIRHHTANEKFHFCPYNEKFYPNSFCKRHLECNDPIFRCFDIAQVATENAKAIPEYRVEYEEIAASARSFSVELLNQCKNSNEVSILLAESAGSQKYFRYAKLVRYPRVRLAIEHHHKEFAGHMYCQQMLRQEWHGNVKWHGKKLPYKILYFLLQTLLTPVYLLMSYVVYPGRDIKMFMNDTLPEVSEASNKIQKFYYRYLHWSNRVVLNLDVPINRYLSTTGYYLVYLALLIIAVLRPLSMKVSSNEGFSWFYGTLLLFALSMLFQDILTMSTMKSIKAFFKFWRVYDFIWHSALFVALIIKLALSLRYKCLMDLENEITYCDPDIKDNRELMDLEFSVIFAFAAICSMTRLIYWFQLHDRAGPIITYLSRVVFDVWAVGFLHLLCVTAFTSGFMFILTATSYQDMPNHHSNFIMPELPIKNDTQSFLTDFSKIFQVLYWAILDPGPSDYFEGNDQRTVIAKSMFALFQVLSAIVLLNLLIATINATVQKIQDKKTLYWKYSRASIWIEYFDFHKLSPPPFTIFEIPFIMGVVAFVTSKKIFEYFSNTYHRHKSQKVLPSSCNISKAQIDKRKTHAKLMSKLIERYLHYKTKTNVTEDITKQDLESVKNDIIQQVLQQLGGK